MRTNPFEHTVFLRSAPGLLHLPADEGCEVAFAGRSNVGKSSVINSLSGRRGLARTSRTPGRTRELGFFLVRPGARLVDLPGYGFAKVSRARRNAWGDLLAAYLPDRRSLAGVVALMDVRHPCTDLDLALLELLEELELPCRVVLNKADKLTRSGCHNALGAVRDALNAAQTSIQLYSSVTGVGVEELRGVVQGWLTKVPAQKKAAPVHRGR